MSIEQNTAAQEHLVSHINAGEVDVAVETFAEDALDHNPAPGQASGREGFRQFWTELTTAFPDAKITPDTVITDTDHVVAAYTLTGTHQGPFQGVEPTGRAISVNGIQIGRFREGKIVERWGSTDELGILKQLQVTELPS